MFSATNAKKGPHQDHFKIKRLADDVFESSFINAYSGTAGASKVYWSPDGNVYLDLPKKGTVVAKSEGGDALKVAAGMDMLTVAVLAVVARTWTNKGSMLCACGVI